MDRKVGEPAMNSDEMGEIQTELIKKCLKLQLEEFELLKSIYCQGELCVDDESVILDITDYINGFTENIYRTIGFTLKILLGENIKCEVSVELSHMYPMLELPHFTIRTSSFNKKQERDLKEALEGFIDVSVDKNDPYIYQAIMWIQDNYEKITKEFVPNVEPKLVKDIELERLWIKSHHIKSKKKRSEIQQLAKDNNLTGFMLSGKPGVICLEGFKENTQYSWKIIRSWVWQKIHVIFTDNLTLPGDIGEDMVERFKRFKGFRELLFLEAEDESKADTKMSMSLFMKYLEDNNSQDMKKKLFGFD